MDANNLYRGHHRRAGCPAPNGADPRASDAADAGLLAQMAAGCGDALAVFLRRYRRLVHRVAVDILNDPAEAEDVTQDVFLEVFRRAHLYDPARGSARCWLLQYAYHRSFRRKAALKIRAAYSGEPLKDAPRPDRLRQRLTPEECRWIVQAGLERLAPHYRTTLELACFEGLSLRDVAAKLGISHGSARHYYYRALAHLQAWARARDMPSRQRQRRKSITAASDHARSRDAAADRADDETGPEPPLLGRA